MTHQSLPNLTSSSYLSSVLPTCSIRTISEECRMSQPIHLKGHGNGLSVQITERLDGPRQDVTAQVRHNECAARALLDLEASQLNLPDWSPLSFEP